MTFSDAQNRRDKFFSGDKIKKSAESDNSDLFKDLICRKMLGTAVKRLRQPDICSIPKLTR